MTTSTRMDTLGTIRYAPPMSEVPPTKTGIEYMEFNVHMDMLDRAIGRILLVKIRDGVSTDSTHTR